MATKKTFYDRFGKCTRDFHIGSNGNTVIIIHDILYFTVTGDLSYIKAIDPEGGPFIHKGFKIDDWIIDEISGYVKIKPPTSEDDDPEYTLVVNCMSKRAS